MTSAALRATLLDLVSVVCVVLALLWVLDPSMRWLRAGDVFVSPDGSDWYLGESPRWAVKTIQRASELAAPGDTVTIFPGVYSEDIRIRSGGKLGQPVVFRAHQPGSVTVTGAAEAALVGLQWRDEGAGIRSTTPPWPVHLLRWGDATLFHVAWGGVAGLKKLTSQPRPWPAFAFERESNRLFVFLPGDAWDRGPTLTTHRPVPSPREWGNIRAANVWVEADHVVFNGLQFDFGVGAGLLLWNASNVAVHDCAFAGADVGVGANPRVGGAHNLRVTHSLYQNYPQYHWQQEWLPWREVYTSYSSSSLVSVNGRGLDVLHNLVSNGGDSVRLSPGPGAGAWGAVVEGNLFYRGTDDAVEAEGEVHGVLVRGNIVYDHHQNLGLSPVWHGPVLVEGNRFLHPHGGLNGSQIKLLNPEVPSGEAPAPPIRNITVRENVFVGKWLAWSNSPVLDVRVANNVFALQRPAESHWPVGVKLENNKAIELPVAGYSDPGTDTRWWADALLGGVRQLPRPGPRWFDWSKHPATRDIGTALAITGWRPAPQLP